MLSTRYKLPKTIYRLIVNISYAINAGTRFGSQQWQTIYFNGHLLSRLYRIGARPAGGLDYLCHAQAQQMRIG